MKRQERRLRLAADTVRQLRAEEIAVVRGGHAIQSDYTECYKYCSDVT